jgi:integrase
MSKDASSQTSKKKPAAELPKGLFRRGNILYTRLADENGKEIWQTTNTSDLTKARQIMSKRRTAIAEGRHMDVKKPEKAVLFHDLCDHWFKHKASKLEMVGAKSMVEIWKTGIGNIPVQQMTASTIQQFLDQRAAMLTKDRTRLGDDKKTSKRVTTRGFGAATQNRHVAMMKSMFNWAIRYERIISNNPALGIKKQQESMGRTRSLTAEEINRLLTDPLSPEYLKNIILASVHTGCRISELTNLRWTEVDLKAGTFTIKKAKAGKGRYVDIDATLLAMMKELPSRFKGGWVFTAPKDDSQPLGNFHNAFNRAVERAGITDFRYHDLRHCFASTLVKHGTDIRTVQELLGHQSLAMTMKYTHVDPERRTQAVRMLDKVFSVGAAEEAVSTGKP